MDRMREARRAGVSGGGGPPPPPRRRLRSGGGGGGGPRDSPRSERRRGERLMLNGGGGGRDDGDETSDESLGDDDADEEVAASAPRYQPVQRRSPSTAPPSSPPQPGGGHNHSSSSSGGGGGSYHNHHHHGGQQQMQRKGGSNPKSPIVWKAADEMIGVPVPRKARSASTKRSSHEWSAPGGGSGGGAGDSSQIQRPSSRPISPASASTTAPARKKLKPVGGGGSSGGSGPAPKLRPSPSSTPSAAPPQPPPAKISKSPSFIQEEIEVAEVLFGLTRQFPCPPSQESNHKLEPRDAPEAKSGNSSPAPLSSAVRPSDSTSLATIAPKRKRPRLVKYDDDNPPSSPAKPDLAEPSSRPEVLPATRSEAKASVSAAAESGTSTATAGAQQEASRELEKTEDHRSRESELRANESDRRDHRPESRAEPPPPPGKPDGEVAPVGSEARNGEATAATKIELASDGARKEKFCIDLMAPPPGKLSPDRDDASDPDADKKGLDSEIDMVGRGKCEKKDGDRARRGLEINLEDEKVQRIPADELAPKKLTLQLDLEKPSLGDEKLPSEQRPPPLQQQQHKSSKAEIKHEKSPLPAATPPPMPMAVGGWLGSFPPFGYLGPVPALSAAGLHHPMDVKPGTSAGLQHAALLPPPPVRPKRCATHCYIAQQIQYHQRLPKMNSFWPPAAAAAAAATRSAPFFGPRPFNMGVVPPAEVAPLLVNPMQGSYPVRAHAPLQEAKAPSMAASPFQGSLSKDKAALSNAAVAESSQRKQPPAHETQQATPVPNMLQGPAFIFPFNQQHAAAVAAATAANRVGDTKSSGVSNAMPPSTTAHSSAANPAAPAMNLSFANLPPADAQFLAILQNGAYPFQVAAHAGGPPSYRGMAPPGPAVPFFNGHVYSSHMLHPSQQQGAQQQNLQKNPMPSLSSSSQKHQPQQPQGLLGYAPNANNSQNYSSGNQRPVLLPGLTHRQDTEKTLQDGPSSDDKSSHPQKGGYDHNFAVPVHLPNFALMPAAGNQSEKKLGDHHHHHQPPTSRGQGVRIDLASSQPFVMPFGSIGAGSAPTGLDFSSLAQNHALFHCHQEAGRHGYPQLNFAEAQSVQGAHHKPQHQITAEAKSAAVDSSSTPSAGDNERKKSASAKYPGDSQQHSLSFSRPENKTYMPPFLSGSTNESSSRTLSLIGSESPNAFGIGSKSARASTPPATSAAAPSTPTTIPQQQQQQQQQEHPFLKLHKQQQQLYQQRLLNSRPRSAAPSNAGGYSDRLNVAMYSSNAAQGGVPGQSPQLKASSVRVTAPPAAVAVAAASPPSNLIMMKNSGVHQQQAKAPMQALSTPNHQSQSSLSMSSSKMGPSVTNLSTGGAGDLSRSSNAPVASGSPSNSVSKSTGGSPPASGSAKGVQPAVQLSSPQQQSAKNSASSSGSKSTPTNHYSSIPMPSILGQQPNVAPVPNSSSKQQSHIPSSKQQPFTQGHFFISSTYTPQPPHVNAGAAAGLYQKRSSDKTQQRLPHQQSAVSGSSGMLSLCSGSMSISTAGMPADGKALAAAAASNNIKALHPPSGGFMHLAAATQPASGVPHSHMSAAQLAFGAMPMPVKPSDQKPAVGK